MLIDFEKINLLPSIFLSMPSYNTHVHTIVVWPSWINSWYACHSETKRTGPLRPVASTCWMASTTSRIMAKHEPRSIKPGTWRSWSPPLCSLVCSPFGVNIERDVFKKGRQVVHIAVPATSGRATVKLLWSLIPSVRCAIEDWDDPSGDDSRCKRA